MIDSNLKELLENLTKINELSKKAIEDLSKHINNNKSGNERNFVKDLSASILTLSKETTVVKNLCDQLSFDGPECSDTLATEAPEEDPLEIPVSNGIEEAVEDPAEKNIEETVEKNLDQTDKQEKEATENVDETTTNVTPSLNKDEKEPEVKPMLKIVDFSKLVDPRNLKLMNENEKSNRKSKNASIIVLSSSDDEPLVNKKEDENSVKNKQNTVSKVQKSQNKKKKEACDKTVNKKEVNSNQNKQKSEKSLKDSLSDKIKALGAQDIRIRSEPYVNLLRIPCEEMKSYYSCKRKEISPKKTMESHNSEDSSNECVSKKVQKKHRSKPRKISESESDESDAKTEKEKKKSKPRVKVHKRVHTRKKAQNKSSNNSDSSDDEEGRTEKKHNNHKIAKSKHALDEDEKESSESEVFDLGNKEKAKEQEESPLEEADADSEKNQKCKSENNDSNSDSDSETFGNIKKKSKQDEKPSPSKDKEESEILISSDDDTSHQKESPKKGIESSDDSDVDTFFRKSKFVRSKKIKSSSESDWEKEQKEKPKESGSEKESENEKVSEKEEEEEINKRKRRRIREAESSDSDDGTTRKKLKKLISRDSLSEKTKKAAAEERERKQRILDKQKKYNQIYEGTDLASAKVDKLVLDVNEENGEPLLQVDKHLLSKLKPHQASGIQFMWDACFESLERIKKSAGSGCILAHCMGLGKTLQVIALTSTLLEEEKTRVKKVLIVTPLSTVLNWKAEFKNWLSGEESFEVFELASIRAQNADRASCVKEWHESGGVMIISYSMFRTLSNEKNKKVSKKFRTIYTEGLVDPGPDLVVCDEGHLLKNEKTSLSMAMTKIRTRRRIVLTGTPLQNNLKEYYCMVQFVKPNLLGTYKEYLNRFVNPITNGQYTDSTQYDINLMRRRSHVLHKLLDGIVQRRDYSVLAPYLPPKFEYVLFLTLTDVQKKLYQHYMDHFAKQAKEEGSNRTSYLFKDFQEFTRICIHPRVLLDKSNDDQQKYQSDEESIGSLKDFIDDDDDSSSSSPESSGSESDSNKKKKKRATKRVTRATKNNPANESESEQEEEEKSKEWWQEYCDGEELDNLAHSTKIMLLFEILKECEQIGDKVLLFSQSLYALNLIEYFLEKVDEATQNGDADEKTCGYTGSWSPGLDYFRLDGSTNCALRSEWCDSFNKDSNSRARLFLLSTRAGGLGINLVAANRVILFDVSWNPSSDVQSIYRVYRFGQLKPSYVYRFVTYGTMEMKIYERQVTKQAISKRVIDEQQIDRHYNQNDLAELYKFEQPDLESRPIPLVPKDVLLGEMLQNHDDKIYKYHEHQSLLENKEDETLNEDERKAAWDEFENEKVVRTKQVFIGKFSINTVQLALRNIIQKDNPSWNNNQILSIIPQLIQQLNLQLSTGDQTMYNRIATEVKIMQDEYARKMQMQFYQYRLQMAAQNQPFQGLLQQQLQMMANRFPAPGVSGLNPNPGNNFNPNDIVELN